MYQMASGRLARTTDISLRASSAEGASANGTGAEVGGAGTIRLKLDVTAVSGTSPTLDITVETSKDNGVTDTWRSLGTFAQKIAVSSEQKSFGGCDRWVRSRSVIGGTATPTVTYSIVGEVTA